MNPLQKINRVATIAVLVGAICFLAAIAQLMFWSVDRRPPFQMKAYVAAPVKAGGTVIVRASVERALQRKCSVTYSRMFFDSSGSRFDVTPGAQMMTSAALDDLNRRTPDALVLSVNIPEHATPGVGALVTVLDYVCNPVHQLYPVSVLLTMDITVL